MTARHLVSLTEGMIVSVSFVGTCIDACMLQIATMVYKVDATSSRLFKIIRDKIKQVCKPPHQHGYPLHFT